MPVGPLLVEEGEVLDDIRAVLAVALSRLALPDARTPALTKLPPAAAALRPREQPRRKLRGPEDGEEAAKRPALRPSLVHVVEVLACLGVDPAVDAHLLLVLVVGIGAGECRVEELVHLEVAYLRDRERCGVGGSG